MVWRIVLIAVGEHKPHISSKLLCVSVIAILHLPLQKEAASEAAQADSPFPANPRHHQSSPLLESTVEITLSTCALEFKFQVKAMSGLQKHLRLEKKIKCRGREEVSVYLSTLFPN